MIETMTTEQIEVALTELVNSRGWKVFTEIVDKNDISLLTEQLVTADFSSLEELKIAQKRVAIFREFLAMPNKLIMGSNHTQIDENDPYAKSQ